MKRKKRKVYTVRRGNLICIVSPPEKKAKPCQANLDYYANCPEFNTPLFD